MAKARPRRRPRFDRSIEAAERYRVQLETHADARTRYTARQCKKATRRVIMQAFDLLPEWIPRLGWEDRDALIEDIGFATIQACRGREFAIGFILDHVSWSRVQWEHERAIYEIGRYIAEAYLRFYADPKTDSDTLKKFLDLVASPQPRLALARWSARPEAFCYAETSVIFTDFVAQVTPLRYVVGQFWAVCET